MAGTAASFSSVPQFELNPVYKPLADQPKAIAELSEGIDDGDRFQTLLGVTGSGKTATMAFAIEQVQRPAPVARADQQCDVLVGLQFPAQAPGLPQRRPGGSPAVTAARGGVHPDHVVRAAQGRATQRRRPPPRGRGVSCSRSLQHWGP